MTQKDLQKKIFLLGPDKNGHLRERLDGIHFYYDPEKTGIIYNYKIVIFTIIFFVRLLTTKKKIISSLKSAYFSALVHVKSCRTIVTMIDNNVHFYNASKLLGKKYRFVVIQNGIKYYNAEYMTAIKNDIHVTDFCCFGIHDVNNLKSSSACVKNYHVIGSLAEIYSRNRIKDVVDSSNKKRPVYDLCLISENWSGWDKKYNGIEESSGKIAEFCQQYCDERNLSLTVAFKSKGMSTPSLRDEISFLKRFVNYNKIKTNHSEYKSWWSAYELCDNSQITIGMTSSLIFESAVRGNKSLMCDFYGDPWSFEKEGLLIHKNREMQYSKFRDTVDEILNMDSCDYRRKIKNQLSFFLCNSNDFDIREFLLKARHE